MKKRPIPNHQGYAAGNDGTIWTCWNNKWGQGLKWRQLATFQNNKYGRRTVRIRRDIDGRIVSRYVHQLVLEAFHGPKPHGTEALHVDGNAWNNTPENLRWGSRSENITDFRAHGRKKGQNHHGAKLTDSVVRTIRTRAAAGETHQAIADSVGVQREAIGKIIRRERWNHVE